MRKAAFWVSLAYIIVLYGTVVDLPGALGSFIRLFGAPAAFLWMLSLPSSRRMRKLNLFHGLFLLWFAWNALSSFWCEDPQNNLAMIWRYSLMVGMSFMLWDLYRTREEADAALQAFVLGGYVLVLSTVYNFFTHNQVDNYAGRYAGGGFNPNDVGKIFGISIPIAWYLGFSKPNGSTLLRTANRLYPVLTTLALLVTASRGGILACIPAYLYVIWNFRRLPLTWRLTCAVAACLCLVGLTRLDLSAQLSRVSSLSDPGSGSGNTLNGRTDIWQAGWHVFTQSPFLGVGAGSFQAATYDATVAYKGLPAHNTLLSVATELGIVGFVLFVALVIVVYRAVMRHPRPMRDAWLVSFIAWVFSIMSSAWEARAQTWLFFVLVVVSAHAAGTAPVQAAVARLGRRPRRAPAGSAGRVAGPAAQFAFRGPESHGGTL